jgi:predicted TIM-barrel fold metal-dependent hydrolase
MRDVNRLTVFTLSTGTKLTPPRAWPGIEGTAMNDTDLNGIIDFHAHAFPDSLADRAIAHLEKEGTAKAFLDGRVSSLLASMDSTGIGRAVVCSIATKPDQFAPILNWSRQIATARIVPLPSVHPRGPDPVGKARLVAQAGLPGIKLHPYYQDFELDDPALFHFFRVLEQMGLLVVCHTGFDFAFPRDRKADPVRIVRLLDKFPNLRFVATHIGAWEDWDEVERHLLGKPIYMEISMSLEQLGLTRGRELLTAHPADRILFGSDSPWTSQAETLRLARALDLGPERERLLLGENARALLASKSNHPASP